MSPRDDVTRAETARRRLADLVAAFEAGDAPSRPSRPEPADDVEHRTGWRVRPPDVRRVHVGVVAIVLVAAALVTAWWWTSSRPDAIGPAATPTVVGDTAAATPAAGHTAGVAPSGEVVVDVAGKVVRPGIVTLAAGSRVVDAVAAAGGALPKADTTGLNLARVLVDGEQIVVGIDPPPAALGGARQGSGDQGAAARVQLNTATAEQLDTLPGVGPVTAAAIIAWRDSNGGFRTVDDLLEVKGIGEATLADLRDRVTP